MKSFKFVKKNYVTYKCKTNFFNKMTIKNLI